MSKVKITFGIIVLNGQPFIEYNLRSLYPFAHQIIVVEGACPAASRVATSDGHSTDGTLQALHRFQSEEDPEKKLLIVTAEVEGGSNGFWTEKNEMSQAYAKRATGNYLWQIDSDEFYKKEDMKSIIQMLDEDTTIQHLSFRTLTFWGGLEYKVDGILLQIGDQDFRRLFAWQPGYKYLTHRPPTVVDETGKSIESRNSSTATDLAERGIFLYHYEYLLPVQVRNKGEYYSNAPHCQGLRPKQSWVDECYMSLSKPFRVHNIYRWISWLDEYRGGHPIAIEAMMQDISKGRFSGIALRQTSDIDRLLQSYLYGTAKRLLKLSLPAIRYYYRQKTNLRETLIEMNLWKYLQPLRNRP